MRNRYLSFISCFCFGLLLLTTACRNNTDDDLVVGKDQDEFTTEEHVRIGESLTQEFFAQTEVSILEATRFPDIYNYLNTIYLTLVQTPVVQHRQEFQWEVIVIQNDNKRTAFTAPGGKFFIYTGLLKYLQSEHELLAVMAHEMHYLDQGMVLEELKTAFGGSRLADILLGNEVARLSEMANYLSEIQYSTADVKQADTFVVDMLCPFLYDARGLQSIFERAERDMADLQIEWVDRRPGDLGERIRNVVRYANSCGTNGARYEDRYESYKKRLP